jgi:hypothetical protein
MSSSGALACRFAFAARVTVPPYSGTGCGRSRRRHPQPPCSRSLTCARWVSAPIRPARHSCAGTPSGARHAGAQRRRNARDSCGASRRCSHECRGREGEGVLAGSGRSQRRRKAARCSEPPGERAGESSRRGHPRPTDRRVSRNCATQRKRRNECAAFQERLRASCPRPANAYPVRI